MDQFIVESMKGTIYEEGSGMLAKKVMIDSSLSIESKAIYAYLCSYAWGGQSDDRKAFPTIQRMVEDLGITDKRFYRHRKALVDRNLISITKKRTDIGIKNIYSITAPLNLIKQEVKEGNSQIGGNGSFGGNGQNDYSQNDQGNKRSLLIKDLSIYLSKISEITGVPLNQVQQRVNVVDIKDFNIKTVMSEIEQSSFLKGEIPASRGSYVSMDHFIKPEMIIKIISKQYRDRKEITKTKIKKLIPKKKPVKDTTPDWLNEMIGG